MDTRLQNEPADELTNECSERFEAANRISMEAEYLPFLILLELISAGLRTYEAIDRLTMEGLAGTANLDPAGPGGAGADRDDASGGVG